MKITRSDGLLIEFPRGSDLGVSCELSAIREAANLRRTVSGGLRNIGDPVFRKYEISISASGLKLPSIEGLWEGDLVTIEAPVMLRESGTVPSRPAVEGSIRVVDGYVEYRPVFAAMVTGKSQTEQHDKAEASWSIQAEEI